MRRIDRYIFKTVLGATLVALLVLVALDAIIALLGELEDLGKGEYGLLQMGRYILLTLPRRTYEVFPMALLLGGILGMGALAGSSELVVMRTSGLSTLRLVWAALKAGLVFSLLALAIGEFIAPTTEQAARELRAGAQSEAIAIRAGRGFWARDGRYFINVRAVLPGIRLIDIHIYEIDDRSALKSIAWAQGARYLQGQWVLDGVIRSAIQPDALANEYLVSLAIQSAINPELLGVLAMNPENLSIRSLHTYIDYLQNNGLETGPYRLAFWMKSLAPLANLVMLFIAIPFAFIAPRTVGVGQRLVVGICLGLVFYLLNRMLGNVVLLYNLPPWLGAVLPSLLFLTAGLYALRWVR